MNIERVNLNLLRLLVAIYEEGSLSAAAERLLMTQPGLSHALRRARDAFGDALFVRTPRGMAPTPRARELYPRIRAALRQLEEALAPDEAFDPSRSTRLFRLGVNDYGTLVVLPPLLRRLSRAGHAVAIRSRHTPNAAQLAALEAREIDAAIGAHDSAPRGFESEPLLEEDAVGIVAAENARFAGPITLEAYAEAPHVIMGPDGEDRSWVDDLLAAHGLRRTVAHAVPHFAALFELVPDTDFVSTVPRRLARRLADGGALRVFELPIRPKTHEIRLLWHCRDSGDSAHAWLRAELRLAAAGLAQEMGRG